MGATTSASVPLPDDEACEAVLRKFIAEDLERAERLLHRAAELLGGWFTVFHEMRGVVMLLKEVYSTQYTNPTT